MLRRVSCCSFLPCCCRYREPLFGGHRKQRGKGRRIDDAYNNNKHCSFLLLEHLLPPSVQAHPLCSTPALTVPEAAALKTWQTWPGSKTRNEHLSLSHQWAALALILCPVYCWVKQILGTITLSILFKYSQSNKRNLPSTKFNNLAL